MVRNIFSANRSRSQRPLPIHAEPDSASITSLALNVAIVLVLKALNNWTPGYISDVLTDYNPIRPHHQVIRWWLYLDKDQDGALWNKLLNDICDNCAHIRQPLLRLMISYCVYLLNAGRHEQERWWTAACYTIIQYSHKKAFKQKTAHIWVLRRSTN